MGEIILSQGDLQKGKEVNEWFRLQNRPGKPKETVRGDINIKYIYYDKVSQNLPENRDNLHFWKRSWMENWHFPIQTPEGKVYSQNDEPQAGISEEEEDALEDIRSDNGVDILNVSTI